MLLFKNVELCDRPIIEKYLRQGDSPLLNYSFQIYFLYQPIFQYQYAIHDELLFVKTQYKENHMLFFPIGNGDLKRGIQMMIDFAEQKSFAKHCYQVTPERMAMMEQMFPKQFEFIPMRDRFEYIYLRERLATLKGRSLQSKRNNVNHFNKTYQWTYEIIDNHNIEECKILEQIWNEEEGTVSGSGSILDFENRTTKRCFEYYKELNINGGLIRLNGRVSAFSFGCRLNSDTYLVLFEKAHPNIRGLYSTINQQLILNNAMAYKYVNREEDAGDPGLRNAKMQYHPDILQEIYCAREK